MLLKFPNSKTNFPIRFPCIKFSFLCSNMSQLMLCFQKSQILYHLMWLLELSIMFSEFAIYYKFPNFQIMFQYSYEEISLMELQLPIISQNLIEISSWYFQRFQIIGLSKGNPSLIHIFKIGKIDFESKNFILSFSITINSPSPALPKICHFYAAKI